MKYYTMGEIHKLGLLVNHKGEAYKHKATISKVVNRAEYKEIKTPFGLGKALSEKQIRDLNNRF